jgi:hypothetical protein
MLDILFGKSNSEKDKQIEELTKRVQNLEEQNSKYKNELTIYKAHVSTCCNDIKNLIKPPFTPYGYGGMV